jgi:hypothetical protein
MYSVVLLAQQGVGESVGCGYIGGNYSVVHRQISAEFNNVNMPFGCSNNGGMTRCCMRRST